MHVFTKLEFGEYVFLLLSRKIEISYKGTAKGVPEIHPARLLYIPCLRHMIYIIFLSNSGLK